MENYEWLKYSCLLDGHPIVFVSKIRRMECSNDFLLQITNIYNRYLLLQSINRNFLPKIKINKDLTPISKFHKYVYGL